MKKILTKILSGTAVATIIALCMFTSATHAASEGFSMSPMKQSIILNPGDSYQTSVSISNPGTNEEDFKYKVSVVPFYVDDKYQTVFEENGSYNQIVDWITLTSPDSGSIKPNEMVDIHFKIDVPEDAPSGGQYASILVSSIPDGSSGGMSINETISIGHTIYAEIVGNTIKQGEFSDISVPGILFSGNITGTASIKNTGNTHGTATYTLQVFPLFSDEEVYTNAEDPETHIIIPDRTYYHETTWSNTPNIGIFNVVYTVEFEGVTQQVSKMVIKCPIWLLFIIIFIIIALIAYFVVRTKKRSKTRKSAE